ncbi:hypothetical protein FRC01_012491 [Tulasnella sp. 417]|nr:hypothetical protein FRC01_012491 [Tulasnella sp. 417]
MIGVAFWNELFVPEYRERLNPQARAQAWLKTQSESLLEHLPTTQDPTTTASSTRTRAPNGDLIFRGEGGEECEEFLYNVRRAVVDNGRQDDERWITSYAASCMSGPAERWHVSLDGNTKTSWDALQKAMVTQWPAKQFKAITPGQSKLARQGVVKVVRQSKILEYLRHQPSETASKITVSSSAEAATWVLYRPSNGFAELELMSSSGDLSYLGGTMMDPSSAYGYQSSNSAAHRLRDATLSIAAGILPCELQY